MNAVLLAISLALSLAVAEGIARWTGARPWPSSAPATEPAVYEFDALLGWKSRPGAHLFPTTASHGPLRFTIWPDGSRATGPRAIERATRVVLVGDSFTQGYEVSDEETFAWKLQQQFPAASFRNYGTGGYSTYQSLLRIKLALKGMRSGSTLVLYGLTDYQELRNVGDLSWLIGLSLASYRGHVYVPYCLLGPDGRLVRHPPERYPPWPFRETSAIVNTLEMRYFVFKTRARQQQVRPVTERLLASMAHASGGRDAQLVVLLLGTATSHAHYARFLAARGIAFIDCDFPATPDLLVGGIGGHPNGELHTRWADCIAERLQDGLPG